MERKGEGKLIKNIAMGIAATYFWIYSEEAKRQANIFFANPNQRIALKVKNKIKK